jgi:hypothetical protein
MEPRQIVLHLLLPPDEQPSEAVHLGVRALRHPAARLVARNLALGLPFFAAAPHVSGVAPVLEGLAYRLIVVPLVQTHGLGCIPYFLEGARPDGSWVLCRERSKTRSKVPLYFAQRKASIWFALVTYHQAPDRLSLT